jgi:beta-N-acetylhexosaminidase
MTSCIEGLSLEQLCGQLFVVGFDGTELPSDVAQSIAAGTLGGVILFRRNLSDLAGVKRLCSSIRDAFPQRFPAFIGIDEEGGRVSRLPEPFQRLPPMRWFGARDDVATTRRAAIWLSQHLTQLGINCNFAPVLDVDTNPKNPIIGDRSFSSDAQVVARHASAYVDALQQRGVGACGKHFPGHGDTNFDSHVELPVVTASRERLNTTELLPFRACIDMGIASLMTAHVKYPSLDADRIATFSPAILTDLLRHSMGFQGVVFSDDLEMGAVANETNVETAACLAIRAGCDVVLVCRDRGAARRAHASLTAEAERDAVLLKQVMGAATRFMTFRQRFALQMHSEASAPSLCFEM